MSLGANWSAPIFSADGSPQIISNAVATTSGTVSGGAVYTPAGLLSGRIEAFLTQTVLGGNCGIEYMVTGEGGSPSGYRLFNSSNTSLKILRYTAGGSFTTLLTVTQTISAGDSFGVYVDEAAIHHVYYKPSGGSWAEGGSVTDATWTSGKIGVFISFASTATRIDDFGGGRPPVPFVPHRMPAGV